MSFEKLAIRALIMLSMFGYVLPFHNCVQAEEPWGFSPYKVRAWIQFADHPTLNEALYQDVCYEVPAHAELLDRSGWKIDIERAPKEYQHLIVRDIEQITFTEAQMMSPDMRQGDRLAFVHVDFADDLYTIRSRQFDCQTHLWGPTSTKTTRYVSRLPRVIFETIRDTLVPIAKIEKIEGQFVRLRIRASQIMKTMDHGVLVPNTQSPGWIDMNSIFMPVVRMNDRDGYIRLKDGIKVYDWTFLKPVEEVRSEHVESESYIRAEIHGAKRAPMAGRTNRSMRKFALVVRPTLTETKLTLVTKDKNPKPIPDKQIFAKYPGESDSKEIGRTNRKGEIIIKSDDHPLHLIYIKSGERRILARLPIVPGYFENLEANMRDDKVRLRAEGVLAGLEFNFMDLTVRRQVLALRIRTALTKGNAKEARRIYNEKYLALETRDTFKSRIDKAVDQGLLKELDDQVPDQARQKELIKGMFGELQKLVSQKMAGDLDGQLNREINTVEAGGVYKPSNDNLDTSNIDKDLKDAQKSGSN